MEKQDGIKIDAGAFGKDEKTPTPPRVELIVFTNTGQTYFFDNVENFRPTTTGFSFDYVGKATGLRRHAVFNNTSTSGYALKED